MMTPIINVNELLTIQSDKNLILIDATNGNNAYENYLHRHLNGALYIDLNTQLADIKEDLANGGRHPLPTPQQFSKVLSDLGITPDSRVVIYDHHNGANAAARFWWMLKAIGHSKVQVLNGGFKEAEKQGFPINDKAVTITPASPYPVINWQLPLVDMNIVEKVAKDNRYMIIDVRSKDRFNGKTEPIDLVAGHIPGAINVPFASNNLDENGLFLSPAELRIKYLKITHELPAKNIIVHCGSGVTACHTILAMDYAQLDIPQLYVGSWSEWSRNKTQ